MDPYKLSRIVLNTPKLNWLIKFVNNVVLTICLFCIYALIMLQVLFINLKDVYEVAALVESWMTCTQLVTRKIVVLLNRPEYERILNNIQTGFWMNEKFSGTHKQEMLFATILARGLLIFGSLTCLMFCVLPFMDPTKMLPMQSWYPADNPAVYTIIYSLQSLHLAEAIFNIPVFDIFFVLFSTDILVQFRVLNHCFETISYQDTDREIPWEQLKKYTEHLKFLYDLHKRINGIYGFYFIIQFLVTVLTVSIQFYILSNGTSSMEYQVKSVFYTLGLGFQVALFCIPASNLDAEAAKLPIAIYNSNWYLSEDLQLQKAVILSTLRAQKDLNMTAKGCFIVNRNEFIQIFRTSFSISTLLNTLN